MLGDNNWLAQYFCNLIVGMSDIFSGVSVWRLSKTCNFKTFPFLTCL